MYFTLELLVILCLHWQGLKQPVQVSGAQLLFAPSVQRTVCYCKETQMPPSTLGSSKLMHESGKKFTPNLSKYKDPLFVLCERGKGKSSCSVPLARPILRWLSVPVCAFLVLGSH